MSTNPGITKSAPKPAVVAGSSNTRTVVSVSLSTGRPVNGLTRDTLNCPSSPGEARGKFGSDPGCVDSVALPLFSMITLATSLSKMVTVSLAPAPTPIAELSVLTISMLTNSLGSTMESSATLTVITAPGLKLPAGITMEYRPGLTNVRLFAAGAESVKSPTSASVVTCSNTVVSVTLAWVRLMLNTPGFSSSSPSLAISLATSSTASIEMSADSSSTITTKPVSSSSE